MKAFDNSRVLQNSKDFKTMQFGIKSKNLGHIIGLLRDEIYSDKILAVIREYSCNAFDANVMAGRGNEPIVVTLPTKLSPEFRIRDFGSGLSSQDIEDIFISYGESTKRNTNDAVGFLGIGAKSGFAYNDNFLVISYHNDIKTTYDCVLDSSNVGSCLELAKSKMDSGDKEGIEIVIPVRIDDIDLFVKKAREFFQYWNIKPIFKNHEKDMTFSVDTPVFVSKDGSWAIYQTELSHSYNIRNRNSVAVMGNIAYPIDWNTARLTGISDDIIRVFTNNRVMLKFGIGELQFSPSRESLQYTDVTNNSLSKLLLKVSKELQQVVKDTFANCKTLEEAMMLYRKTFEDYGGLFYHNDEFNKNLVWNGITINSSRLNFMHCDRVKGYSTTQYDSYSKTTIWNPVAESYIKRIYASQIRRFDGFHCESYRVTMDGNCVFLLINQDKKVYIRKAVKYLMNKYNKSKVVVLKFDNDASRKSVFDNLHLNHFVVIQYSDISDDVRKTIVRVSSNGTVTTHSCKGVFSSERYVKYLKYGNSYSRRENDIHDAETIDLNKVTGYYFQFEDNRVKYNNQLINVGSFRDKLNNILTLADSFLGIDKSQIKVYAFGKQIRESKRMSKIINKNWVSIESLESKIYDKMTETEKFKKRTGHITANNSLNFDNHEGLYKLLNDLNKRKSLNASAAGKLLKLLKEFNIPTKSSSNDYKVYQTISAIVNDNMKKVCHNEYETVLTATKKFFETYPMLQQYVVNDYSSNGWNRVEHNVNVLSDYVELCNNKNK